MSARDGDGWVQCDCGAKHWGLHGAAGLLLYRENSILLQHRAPWVHNGDTWGIPGGARDSHESIVEGALREAIEETGIDPQFLNVMEIFSDPHGSWSYETVIAQADVQLIAHEVNDESLEVRWVEFENVTRMPLHPSFARSWPLLRQRLDNLIAPE